jgi:hypothetical protein
MVASGKYSGVTVFQESRIFREVWWNSGISGKHSGVRDFQGSMVE